MQAQLLSRPHRQARPVSALAAGHASHAAAALPVPRHNQILATLPPADYDRLLPHLKPVPLPAGWVMHRPGDEEKYLYFITSGIVSKFYVLENGALAEFAVTGNEGVIGIASFLGGDSTPSEAVVLSAGHAFRLRADLLQGELTQDSPLLRLLLLYTQALITQIGQMAVCNRHHALEQRLCRWLLLCLDRLPGAELMVTQENIAHMLGVRREGVTHAAGRLQQAGLLHYYRGSISVLDRPALQARACECYAVIRHEYERLLPVYRQVEGVAS